MNEQALEAAYATIPTIECRGLCSRSCGPVFVEVPEAERAGAHYRTIPRAAVAAFGGGERRSFLAGDEPFAVLDVDRKARCHLLRAGRCTVYDLRPGICRLWGIVETMPCHMGCIPERWLTAEEGDAVLAAIAEACRA